MREALAGGRRARNGKGQEREIERLEAELDRERRIIAEVVEEKPGAKKKWGSEVGVEEPVHGGREARGLGVGRADEAPDGLDVARDSYDAQAHEPRSGRLTPCSEPSASSIGSARPSTSTRTTTSSCSTACSARTATASSSLASRYELASPESPCSTASRKPTYTAPPSYCSRLSSSSRPSRSSSRRAPTRSVGRVHRHRYHAVLAPNARPRPHVVALGRPDRLSESPPTRVDTASPGTSPEPVPERASPARIRWAVLLARHPRRAAALSDAHS